MPDAGQGPARDRPAGGARCSTEHHVALVLHAALFLLAVVHGVIALPQTGPQAGRHGLTHGPMEACGMLGR